MCHRSTRSCHQSVTFSTLFRLIAYVFACCWTFAPHRLNGSLFANGQDTCDACQFDGNDADDCRDYGKIDNELVAWHLGSQQCKDTYNIKITSPDPAIICSSANSFVNALRFGSLSSSQVKLGLGVAEGGFFIQDGSNNNAIVLKDSITIDGETYDCEASESSCYNAMKPYFQNDPNGQQEMQDVCDQLVAQNKVDKQLEQSTLRIRLCMESQEGATIPSVCEPLWTQLEDKMNEYPNKACPGFGFGTGNTQIPGCENTSSSPKLMLIGSHVFLVWVAVFLNVVL